MEMGEVKQDKIKQRYASNKEVQSLQRKVKSIEDEYLGALYGHGKPLTLKRGKELVVELQHIITTIEKPQMQVEGLLQVSGTLKRQLDILVQEGEKKKENYEQTEILSEFESQRESPSLLQQETQTMESTQVTVARGILKKVSFSLQMKGKESLLNLSDSTQTPTQVSKSYIAKDISIFDLKYKKPVHGSEYFPLGDFPLLFNVDATYPTEWSSDFDVP